VGAPDASKKTRISEDLLTRRVKDMSRILPSVLWQFGCYLVAIAAAVRGS
jgi:hypothetical protein